jgi:hypothetical protein
MRIPVGLYLRAGLLFRRYLSFPLCKAARSDSQVTGVTGVVAGGLRRRGLTLG